jgi:hypothetical protein
MSASNQENRKRRPANRVAVEIVAPHCGRGAQQVPVDSGSFEASGNSVPPGINGSGAGLPTINKRRIYLERLT